MEIVIMDHLRNKVFEKGYLNNSVEYSLLEFCIEYVSQAIPIANQSEQMVCDFIDSIRFKNKDYDLKYLMRLFEKTHPNNQSVKKKLLKIDENEYKRRVALQNLKRIFCREKISFDNKKVDKEAITSMFKECSISMDPVYLNKEDIIFLLEEIPEELRREKNDWVYPTNGNLYQDLEIISHYYSVLPEGCKKDGRFAFYADMYTYEIIYDSLIRKPSPKDNGLG